MPVVRSISISVAAANLVIIVLKLVTLYPAMAALGREDAIHAALLVGVHAWLLICVVYFAVSLWLRELYALAFGKIQFVVFLALLLAESALANAQPFPSAPASLLLYYLPLLLVNMAFSLYLMMSEQVVRRFEQQSKQDYFLLIKSLPQLFNRRLYGINYYLFFGYLFAAMVFWASSGLWDAGTANERSTLAYFMLEGMKAALLWLVLQYSARGWRLPVFWGLCIVFCENMVMMIQGAEQLFLWRQAAGFFIEGFIFMLAPVVAVRLFGARLPVFLLAVLVGVAGGEWLSGFVVSRFLQLAVVIPDGWRMLQAAYKALLIGGAMYLSLYMYFQRWQTRPVPLQG